MELLEILNNPPPQITVWTVPLRTCAGPYSHACHRMTLFTNQSFCFSDELNALPRVDICTVRGILNMSSSALGQEYGECISSVGSHISLSACETLVFPMRSRRFVFAGKLRRADWYITQLYANRYGVTSQNRAGLRGGPAGQLPEAPSFSGT
jgi:hypothetical protein